MYKLSILFSSENQAIHRLDLSQIENGVSENKNPTDIHYLI